MAKYPQIEFLWKSPREVSDMDEEPLYLHATSAFPSVTHYLKLMQCKKSQLTIPFIIIWILQILALSKIQLVRDTMIL